MLYEVITPAASLRNDWAQMVYYLNFVREIPIFSGVAEYKPQDVVAVKVVGGRLILFFSHRHAARLLHM